jgi:predicted ABC-type ATPase
MIDFTTFDQRPVIVALAGPNGAGKTTFFHSHLAKAGLPFINADVLALEIGIGPYDAARQADALRRVLLDRRESFVFETVFSDPVGAKVAFLEEAGQLGYTVVLCYIGLSSAQQSVGRVKLRVLQGGHDVPDDKLLARYARTLDNLRLAIRRLPNVLIFDNSDLVNPYRLVARYERQSLVLHQPPIPAWLQPLPLIARSP